MSYTNAINLADRLIRKKGAPAIVKRPIDGAPVDPDKPWRPSAGTFTDYNVFAVILDFRPDQVEGYAFQRGDRIMLIPKKGLPITIEPTDLIEMDNQIWTIIQPSRVYPGLEDVVFQNYVRAWPRRLS